uniref:Major facilitator superfamily (MFS) profile domain-containing protein n=1 Tax=Knipowitschia caucasica TaxID=637954 RepID=A0AAV2LZV6_KNICA
MPPPATANLGYTPPDGGWGWVVVFAAFISIGFSYAFPKSLTVYFKEIQEYFGASYSEIAWVSSVMLASMYAAGPISSALVNRYGSRPVVMVGGILVGVGMVSASFGTSIVHLYICVGVIGGFGLALNLQPSLTIIGTYFQAKRPLANGLAMTGSPVVLFTLAPLNQYLFDSYGWRGSFLILGGIVLNCCVAGSLMRPVKKTVVSKTEPSECHEKEAAGSPRTEDSSKSQSSLLFETLMDLVGAKRFSSAVGLCTIIECGPVLLGPPMSGALVDVFGDYKYMYYVCGVFMLVPGIYFFVMHYYNYRKLEEERHRAAVEMRTAEDTVHLNINQK